MLLGTVRAIVVVLNFSDVVVAVPKQKQVSVKPRPLAVDMTHCPHLLLGAQCPPLSVDSPAGAQQQTRRCRSMTDAPPFHRPRSAYRAGIVVHSIKAAVSIEIL